MLNNIALVYKERTLCQSRFPQCPQYTQYLQYIVPIFRLFERRDLFLSSFSTPSIYRFLPSVKHFFHFFQQNFELCGNSLQRQSINPCPYVVPPLPAVYIPFYVIFYSKFLRDSNARPQARPRIPVPPYTRARIVTATTASRKQCPFDALKRPKNERKHNGRTTNRQPRRNRLKTPYTPSQRLSGTVWHSRRRTANAQNGTPRENGQGVA